MITKKASAHFNARKLFIVCVILRFSELSSYGTTIWKGAVLFVCDLDPDQGDVYFSPSTNLRYASLLGSYCRYLLKYSFALGMSFWLR